VEDYDLRHDLSAERNFGYTNTEKIKDTRKQAVNKNT